MPRRHRFEPSGCVGSHLSFPPSPDRVTFPDTVSLEVCFLPPPVDPYDSDGCATDLGPQALPVLSPQAAFVASRDARTNLCYGFACFTSAAFALLCSRPRLSLSCQKLFRTGHAAGKAPPLACYATTVDCGFDQSDPMPTARPTNGRRRAPFTWK